MKASTNLGKWITKIWAPIAVLLGAITAIVQFIQLWRGDQETVTQVLWIGGITLIWVSLYYIGFSKSESPIRTSDIRGNQKTRQVYSYGEKLSKISRTFLFLSLLGVLALWGLSIRHNNLLKEKVVVLIADFDGPDPKSYRVTEQLLSQLSNSLSEYDDTLIVPLEKVITEQEGSKKAQELGKSYNADLVIWGWYGVTESDVLLTIHVENLSESRYLLLKSSNLYGTQLPAYEIKSFQIQQRFSSQMTALTLFLGGLIRYEADDYQDAINRFSEAINEQWPDDLISRKFLLFYRGLSYYISLFEHGSDINSVEDDLNKAIADFSQAIEIDSGFWQVYYYRTISYAFLNDYSNAEEDYETFTAKAPTDTVDYKALAYLATVINNDSKAIEYYSIVIENDPNDALSLNNRGQVYVRKGEYETGLNDLNRAIQLEPNNELYYLDRAEIYRATDRYDLALKDINHALKLHSDQDDLSVEIYFIRGLIYADMNNHANALDDFSYAIQLSPKYYLLNYSRGVSYFRLEEYEKAIQDFSVYIQNNFDFTTPNAHYYRGAALEKLGYPGDALMDYSYAAQFYAYFAKSWHDGGYVDQAEGECEGAIKNFRELSDNSKNDSIVRWATSVVKAFQSTCPISLVERVPTKNWLIELATNPIIPGSGMAGIKMGDSQQFVIEHLDNAFSWFRIDDPNVTDCCFGGSWGSDNLFIHILFSIKDKKVVDLYLDGSLSSSRSEYIPLVNGVSIGTSEEELLLNWGNPISSGSTETPVGCTVIYYNGIRFRTCGENKLVDVIDIPGIVLENSSK